VRHVVASLSVSGRSEAVSRSYRDRMAVSMGVDVDAVESRGKDEAEHLKTVIEQVWSSAAGCYDQMWGHGLRTDVERKAWLALLEGLFPPEHLLHILDVGCGTGFLSLLLAELGHSMVGLDLTEQMLAEHQRRAKAHGLDISLVRGDAEDPPLGLGSFDAVVSRHLLWTLLRPQLAVRAWTALVVPGGRVVAIDIIGMLATTPGRRLRAACGQAIQSLSESAEPARTSVWRALRTLVQTGDPHYPAELAGRLPLQAASTPDPVKNIWQRAGLRDVMTEELSWLDHVERSQMPAAVRMQNYWRRYLIEGRR
jgi:ubiquinone/menaquinone biosynthesis C-methylase UbiE